MVLGVLLVLVITLVTVTGFDGAFRPRMTTTTMKGDDPIVVTGMGCISPVGKTHTEFFDNLCNGVSGIDKISRFDAEPFKCQIGGQVKDFNPRDYYKSRKKIKQNDLYTHYAVAASHTALEDAGIDLKAEGSSVDANRVGCIIGSAFGGFGSFEQAAGKSNLKFRYTGGILFHEEF